MRVKPVVPRSCARVLPDTGLAGLRGLGRGLDDLGTAWHPSAMGFMRATWHAFAVYAVVAPALVVFWMIVLGPGMQGIWPRLPGAWRAPVGASLLGFAVISGVGIYLASLAWRLAGQLQAGSISAVPLQLLAAGLLPLAVSVGLVWLIFSNLRIGW
jgi:hypothetical protein